MADNMVPIKQEPEDNEDQQYPNFWPGEVINLVSEDEDDNADMPTATPAPSQAVNKPTKAEMYKLLLTKQRETANKYRLQKPTAKDTVETSLDPFKFNRAAEKRPTAQDFDSDNEGDPKSSSFEELQKRQKAPRPTATVQEREDLTAEEQIALIQAEFANKERLRKEKLDANFDRPLTPENDDENTLFIPEREDSVIPTSYTDVFEEEDEQPKKKKKKRGRPTKDKGAVLAGDSDDNTPANRRKPAKRAKTTAGIDYTDEQLEAVLELSRQSSRAPKKGKKDVPKKGKANGRGKKKLEALNFNSIYGSNVFEDAEAVADRPNQPEFQGFTKNKGTRKQALNQLIASLPTGDDAARSDIDALTNAVSCFTGKGNSIRAAEDGNWSLVGMKSTLKHYQVLGVAFMRSRENSSQHPKGGILADDMGLGKTIMMLANIVNGKPEPGSRRKATLIVAAPALVKQWRGEIDKHCATQRENKRHGMGMVIVHRAGSRMQTNCDEEVLGKADVVLTTYHEIIKSYPKAKVPIHLTTAKEKDEWWRETYEREKGVLHCVQWFRVVLDEAQSIKNPHSITSMACRALDYRHAWCLTGTPILNSIKEFYPYLKMLKEPHTGSFRIFKENFCTPDDPDGIERLQVFLRKCMIRRTHRDTLMGSRLLDLPQPKEHTIYLEFNEVERQIYEIVKKRFIERINSISQRNGLDKQYRHIWSMILRLRQITGHTLLIQGTVMDLLEREDFEKLNKICENEDMNEEGKALLVHLRNVLVNHKDIKSIEAGAGSAILTESSALATGVVDIGDCTGNTGGKFGLSFRFKKYLASLKESGQWEVITQRTTCCGCRQVPQDPHVTSCWHIYCLHCLNDLSHLAARQGHDHARCTECGEAYTSADPCQGIDDMDVRDTSAAMNEAQTTKAKRKEDDWISLKGELLPSAKTIACKAQIMNWLEEDSEAKIIIYVQFLPMIRILERLCATEGWGCCKYTGKMSQEMRYNSVEEFRNDPNKKILLASLKCGGQGLNLVMASRVICIDPWFNQAVEAQAFGRVFRIGQVKETRMLRLVVKNTIDAAMMSMKQRKQMEIDEVMEKKKDNLSVHDLLRLFGDVGEDGEGRPFIFAEDHEHDDPEHLRLSAVDEDDEMGFMGNEE